MATLRDRGWAYFDSIVAKAPLRDTNPWIGTPERAAFGPDYDTLELLLGVPVHLKATSQSGVPALALDVWVAYQFRRAGFDQTESGRARRFHACCPRRSRISSSGCPKRDHPALWSRIERGVGGMGTANLLGKNYVKQVDVVMSGWATGPELMVSTKRMDSSFGKNAANRVEESYGDAKNLRLRHPQAALGFFYSLSAVALETDTEIAAWLIDLLIKLGREDDAYDAVALVLPDMKKTDEPSDPEPEDEAGPIPAGVVPEPGGRHLGRRRRRSGVKRHLAGESLSRGGTRRTRSWTILQGHVRSGPRQLPDQLPCRSQSTETPRSLRA